MDTTNNSTDTATILKQKVTITPIELCLGTEKKGETPSIGKVKVNSFSRLKYFQIISNASKASTQNRIIFLEQLNVEAQWEYQRDSMPDPIHLHNIPNSIYFKINHVVSVPYNARGKKEKDDGSNKSEAHN